MKLIMYLLLYKRFSDNTGCSIIIIHDSSIIIYTIIMRCNHTLLMLHVTKQIMEDLNIKYDRLSSKLNKSCNIYSLVA